MDQKSRPDVSEIIERLVKAKVINTDVSLKTVQEVVSATSSMDIDGGIEGFCGTIRRPWVVIRWYDGTTVGSIPPSAVQPHTQQ